MINIIPIRRNGRIMKYRAVLLIEHRVYREAYLDTERAAKAWVLDQLSMLNSSAAA